MLFGGRLSQALLAVIATLLLAVGLAVLLATAPSLPGIAAFVVLFGLGSGLVSIVGGTLPLEMFGRQGYGSRVGWMSAARQFSSSFAPFLFALMMARTSVPVSIGALWIVAVLGVAVFTAICVAARGRPGGSRSSLIAGAQPGWLRWRASLSVSARMVSVGLAWPEVGNTDELAT